MNIAKITDQIIAGHRIKRGDDLSFFLTAPLAELQEGALRLQDHFCGKHIDFCTIINGRSGRCGENCKYCAQAACHHTDIDEYDFLPKEEIIRNAKANQDAGANRFAIVTSGRALVGKDFDRAIDSTAMGNYSFLFVRNGNSWHGVREITCPEGHYRKVFIVVIRKRRTPLQRLVHGVEQWYRHSA